MHSSYIKPKSSCPLKKVNLKLARLPESVDGFVVRMSGSSLQRLRMDALLFIKPDVCAIPTRACRKPSWLQLVCLVLTWIWAQPLHAQVTAYLLLQDSPLAGFQYHEGKALWSQMRVGDALTLVREPDNVHDAKAVRVEWRGHKIGYVPRRENADVARFMDGGQVLLARISRLAEVRDPWSRVRFEILVPVQPDRLPRPSTASGARCTAC
jgi:hypothetical protein